jgi:hypothetical protein
MRREMPLSEALQQLNLTPEEVQSFLVLVQKESKKMETMDARFHEPMDFANPSVQEIDAALGPVTDFISDAEVRRGRRYVRLLGIPRVAENLSMWEGSAGTWHPIDIDEGCPALLEVSDLGGGGVGLMDGSSNPLPPSMTDAELLVRLDPPADTLNPQRLRSGAPPSVRGHASDRLRVPESGALHPANYVYTAKSGRQYSILDETAWPQWEALYDMGYVTRETLTVATMGSDLNGEEGDVMDVDSPGALVGSLPAPPQEFIQHTLGIVQQRDDSQDP